MKEKNLTPAFGDNKTFKWCGYEWECCMEGGRLIHGDLPWYWMDKEQVYIDETFSEKPIYLYMTDKETTINHWNGKTYHPYKAGGTIRSIKSFSYGTFSADIKTPHGYNLWPSFWISGDKNWPPEIDIYETWTYDDNTFVWTQSHFPWFNPGWKTTNNIHYNGDDLKHTHIGSNNISIFKQWKNPMNHFVNYKVDWFPDSITFYVNNKVVRRITDDTCRKLTENLINKSKGFEMDVIFNVWCENPENFDVHLDTPMVIKNFEYKPYVSK